MKINNTESKLGLADKLHGCVSYCLKDADGKVVKQGNVTNNIVLSIRKPIIKLLSGWGSDVESLPFVRQLALGADDTAANITDTSLKKEIQGSRKLSATVPTISDDGLTVTFSFLYDTVDESVDNKDIKEMGLFATDGTMVARTTVGLWRKTTGLYFEVYWTIGYRE